MLPLARRAGLAALAVASAGVVFGSAAASASARLAAASPAHGSVLDDGPTEIELCFNLLLDVEFHRLELFGVRQGSPPRAYHVATLEPRLDEDDATRVTAAVPELLPGAYLVRWQVLSRDGRTTRGHVRFEIGAHGTGGSFRDGSRKAKQRSNGRRR